MNDSATAPRNHTELQARYGELLGLHQQRLAALARHRSVIFQALALVVAAVTWQTVRSLHGAGAAWPFLLEFLAIAALIALSMNRQARVAREQRLVSLYQRALQRVDGTAAQSGCTGTESSSQSAPTLRPAGHLYERDLDLLGPDSLFGLLATVRTGVGERGLARLLLNPATHAESLLRQQAVRELLPQISLREKIALLGASSFHQISASFFDEWLADAPPVFHPAFRIVLLVTAALNLILLTAGLTHLRPWGDLLPHLALVLAVQGLISLYLRPRVLPLLQGGARLQLNIRLFADGVALLQSTPFASPKLQALQQAALQPSGAARLLKRLENQLAIVEQRSKEWFLVLSLLLAAGTQAAISIAAWKRRHAAPMHAWLNAWAEFEALNALATFAFEHPASEAAEAGPDAYTWPELLPPSHPPLFEARALAHPLLPNAVPNDVALSPATRFLLISGSNMSGKSTLLRSIGVNAVLAYAGAPVRARSLRLTPLTLGASLALTDSLAEGRSKFLAEVQRLAAIAAAARSGPVLFLVDEIFSGTNSADRRTAAAAVLHELLARGAIGALSTHDLVLTDLATPANAGLNVHMASPDPADPLAFDYILKPGVNTSSNALAIIRMMGLDA